MGKKKDKFDVKKEIPREANYTRDVTNEVMRNNLWKGEDAYQRNVALGDDLTNYYKGIFEDPGERSSISNFAETGGWSAADKGRIQGSADDLRDWAKNSIDPYAQNRMRGGGVYEEFAKTGGFSGGDIANYRSRSNAVVPSVFAGLKRNLATQNTASGGFNPGYGAQSRLLARDAARAAAENSVSTETELANMVRSGRQWGAQGMTSSEQQLQDLLGRNYLGGMGAANEAELAMMTDINRNRLGGYQGLSDYNRTRLAALEGLQGIRTQGTNDLAYTGVGLDALNARNQALTNYYGLMSNQKKGFNWGGAASGALSGAATGTMIYPGWGTAVGAVVGGVGGGLKQ